MLDDIGISFRFNWPQAFTWLMADARKMRDEEASWVSSLPTGYLSTEVF